jgi:serine/threonine protein kinase
LKIFKKYNPEDSEIAQIALKNEVEAYRSLRHPNILKLFDYKESAVKIKPDGSQLPISYMALELCIGGSIIDFICLRPFLARFSRYYFKQLLQALEYIHTNGIAHRDLKPENIFLDKNYDIKIADFGFAKQINLKKMKSFVGTLRYMAPEVLVH